MHLLKWLNGYFHERKPETSKREPQMEMLEMKRFRVMSSSKRSSGGPN